MNWLHRECDSKRRKFEGSFASYDFLAQVFDTCLSIHPSFALSIQLSLIPACSFTHQPANLPLNKSIHLPFCLIVHLLACRPSIHPFACSPARPSMEPCLSAHHCTPLPICPSIHQSRHCSSTHQSVHLYTRTYPRPQTVQTVTDTVAELAGASCPASRRHQGRGEGGQEGIGGQKSTGSKAEAQVVRDVRENEVREEVRSSAVTSSSPPLGTSSPLYLAYSLPWLPSLTILPAFLYGPWMG